MATISSLGIGSGLDSESIVTKLAALEKAPLASLQVKQKLGEGKISVFSQIQSQFAALQDAATSVSSSTAFKTTKASSSNPTAATITSTSTARATSFTLDVDALAKSQANTSGAVTTGSLVGAGTMTFRIGTWSGGGDNSGIVSADAALAAAQAAVTTATTNKTNADAALLTATSDKDVADTAYADALAAAAGPAADLAAADATLASKVSAYNAAVTAFNTATSNQTAKVAALASASTAKTNADNAFTAASGIYTAAQTDTATKLSQYGAATVAANSAINSTSTGLLAGAATLASFANSNGEPKLKAYSDAYTAWSNAVAANDRSSPTLQAIEDAALAAFNQAKTELDALDGGVLLASAESQISAYTSPATASTLKGDAATKLTAYNTAVSTEASALSALNTATATQASALAAFNLATTEKDAADTALATAQGVLDTATSERDAAAAAQTAAAAIAAPLDAALVAATATKNTNQAAYDAALAASLAADAALATAQTNLTAAQNGTTSARPTFTPGAGADIAITVTASDTVSTLADKINAANIGVVATVFRTGTTERLQLTSKATGAAAGFRVQVTDGDGNNTDEAGLSRFAFDPQVNAYGMAAVGNTVTYGQDARARINGLAVTSSTNTFADNVPGVTITVAATTTTNYNNVGGTEARSPVTMSVSDDVTPAVKSVDAFVKAYNALVSNLTELTKYDATTRTPGAFQGDASVNGLLSVLRSMVGSVSSGSVYSRLSDVGIQMQRDGTLSVNTIKLGAAANNGDELTKLFTQDNKNAATNGFALKFAALAKGVLGTGGAVANKAAALQKELKTNSEEQQKVTERAARTEARLRAQYAALDKRMASLSALNSYVAQQVTSWNKNNS